VPVPLTHRAVRLAGRAAKGVYVAFKARILAAASGEGDGAGVGAGRPVLSASARGAEVAVASGRTGLNPKP